MARERISIPHDRPPSSEFEPNPAVDGFLAGKPHSKFDSLSGRRKRLPGRFPGAFITRERNGPTQRDDPFSPPKGQRPSKRVTKLGLFGFQSGQNAPEKRLRNDDWDSQVSPQAPNLVPSRRRTNQPINRSIDRSDSRRRRNQIYQPTNQRRPNLGLTSINWYFCVFAKPASRAARSRPEWLQVRLARLTNLGLLDKT